MYIHRYDIDVKTENGREEKIEGEGDEGGLNRDSDKRKIKMLTKCTYLCINQYAILWKRTT